jgi:hypothetical protein
MLNEPLLQKADQLINLMAGTIDAAKRQELLSELRDRHSEASMVLKAIHSLARAQIDLAKIPGLEEIARMENRGK